MCITFVTPTSFPKGIRKCHDSPRDGRGLGKPIKVKK